MWPNLLDHYIPVKGVIYHKEDGALWPLPKINSSEYFEEHGCGEELRHLYSGQMKAERMARPKPTMCTVHRLIAQEYRSLRKVLKS